MKTTRIAFVGTGNMGQAAHLQNYMLLPDCEIVALAEMRSDLARKVAQRYGISKVYADPVAMLTELGDEIDGIVASQPFDRHVQVLPTLLAAGIPLLSEKPLAASIADGRKLLDVVATHQTDYYLAYHKRSDPAVRFGCDHVESWRQSGLVGQQRYVRLTMPPGDWIANGFSALLHSAEPKPSAPMAREGDQPFIEFINYYIHQVNLMRLLIGADYRVLSADPAGLTMTVQGANGVIGLLEMAPWQTTSAWQEQAMVCFDRGWVKIDLPAPLAHHRPGRVRIFEDPGGRTAELREPVLPWVHAMRQQAAYFVAACRGESTPLCTAQEGLRDLCIAEDYLHRYEGAKA